MCKSRSPRRLPGRRCTRSAILTTARPAPASDPRHLPVRPESLRATSRAGSGAGSQGVFDAARATSGELCVSHEAGADPGSWANSGRSLGVTNCKGKGYPDLTGPWDPLQMNEEF